MTSRYVVASTLRLNRPNCVFPSRRAFHASRSPNNGASEALTNRVAHTPRESEDTKDEDDLSDRVRRLMRPVPHALTVITSFQPGKDPKDEPEPRGLLVSSFNTVTLSPRPYVTFNIKLPSSTWDAIRASGHFMASGIDNSATATAFTIGQANSGDRASKGGWARDWIYKDGRLRDHRVAYWWMHCRCTTTQSLLVEDHRIAVGEVLEAGEYRKGRARILESPLLYANGGYCRLRRPGQAITRKEPGEENYRPIKRVLNYRKVWQDTKDT